MEDDRMAGKTWNEIKEGIIEDSDVFSIIVDPKSPRWCIRARARESIRARTEEASSPAVGVNKTQGIPSTARRTRVLMQDPNNLDTVFAGTTEGLYRTFDDRVCTGCRPRDPDLIVNDVYVDPADSNMC